VSWKDEFEKRFNHEPLYTHAYAYDMAAVIYSIVGKNDDRSVSQRLQGVALTGITGALKFDAEGDVRPELTVAEYNDLGMQEVRF
jgi:ABC-type branched-subunit amino acid transport system substrate-binding protein